MKTISRKCGCTGPAVGQALERVVSAITICIADLRQAGFDATADMLAIARIDLLARLHDVADEELDRLVEAIFARAAK